MFSSGQRIAPLRLLRSSRSIIHSFISIVTLIVFISAGTQRVAKAQTPDLVSYPSAEVEFIAGPQLKSGSAQNPWPFFDSIAITKGHEHGQSFPADPPADDSSGAYHNRNYYDQALVQYINYYRTGDVRFRDYARKIADSWWRSPEINEGRVTDIYTYSRAPRSISLGGLMLRALDGRPEMWPWITEYTREMFNNWVGTRVTYDGLYYGVRDGGYMLLYAAWLARVHPDAQVRANFRDGYTDQWGTHPGIVTAAADYYARLQYPDGSWRWQDDFNYDGNDTNDGLGMQPFMVGLLLEAMIATHQLVEGQIKYTAQAGKIKSSILRGVENLYTRGFRRDGVADIATWSDPKLAGTKWLGMWYVVYSKGCETGCGVNLIKGDINAVRDVRQLNVQTIHAFGYAYKLSREPKFKAWGDEIYKASFRGTDDLRALADFSEKQYNQAYRSAGKYLIWRLSGETAQTLESVSSPSQTSTALRVSPAAQSEAPASLQLVSTALASASNISASSAPTEAQIARLIEDIDLALKG